MLQKKEKNMCNSKEKKYSSRSARNAHRKTWVDLLGDRDLRVILAIFTIMMYGESNGSSTKKSLSSSTINIYHFSSFTQQINRNSSQSICCKELVQNCLFTLKSGYQPQKYRIYHDNRKLRNCSTKKNQLGFKLLHTLK